MRISIDTKAKVDLCDSSRGGTSRCKKAVQADDHDRGDKSKLVPLGILAVMTGLLTTLFGVSFETSDFIVDGLEHGWERNKEKFRHIHQLVINLDNGPHNSSYRTQFMKRLTEFADQYDLEIVLAYYPPITANITPSSAVGGILENHWNGALLNTRETTLERAKSMTWKELHPVVELLETVYKKGVRIGKKGFQSIADRITRHLSLPKYYMSIQPQDG